VVEQDVFTAFDLAHRAYVIETGRVAMHGTTEDLGRDPRVRQAYLGL
jgi:branched-chain amino acid transport system ATP-binding protein